MVNAQTATCPVSGRLSEGHERVLALPAGLVEFAVTSGQVQSASR
jgi:hypothetical protein